MHEKHSRFLFKTSTHSSTGKELNSEQQFKLCELLQKPHIFTDGWAGAILETVHSDITSREKYGLFINLTCTSTNFTKSLK